MSKKKKGNTTDYQSLFRLYRKGSEVVNAIQHTGEETFKALSWLQAGTGIDVIDEEENWSTSISFDGNRCRIGDYIVFSHALCYVVKREQFEREYKLLSDSEDSIDAGPE